MKEDQSSPYQRVNGHVNFGFSLILKVYLSNSQSELQVVR